MGLDLTLLPYDCDQDHISYSHTMLEVKRNREKFQEIMKIPATDTPEDFISYRSTGEDGEPRYGKTTMTKYGEHLQYVLAQVLKARFDGPVGAFIDACADNRKIALYWH